MRPTREDSNDLAERVLSHRPSGLCTRAWNFSPRWCPGSQNDARHRRVGEGHPSPLDEAKSDALARVYASRKEPGGSTNDAETLLMRLSSINVRPHVADGVAE
jgi:hypothetical protein